MLDDLRRRDPRAARAFAAVLVAVALSFAVFAGPVSAAASPVHLANPSVSPSVGTRKTTFVFSVVYRHDLGTAAAWVKVTVAGWTHGMSRQPGGDWTTGVTYRWSGRLPVGTQAVSFRARSERGEETAVAWGSVAVYKDGTPLPTPTPTPTRTATPTPTPTPRPTPTPTPVPRSTPPTPTPTPRPTPSPTPPPAASSLPHATPAPTASMPPDLPTPFPTEDMPIGVVDPTASASTAGPLEASPSPSTMASPSWTPVPSASSEALVVVPPPGGSAPPDGAAGAGSGSHGTGGPTVPVRPTHGGGHAGRTWGPLAGFLAATGLQVPSFVELGVAPTLVTTTGAATFAMAFGLFGRRRRDGEPPAADDVLAEQAATGLGTAEIEAGIVVAVGDAFTTRTATDVDVEALMPRWRRPSLMQARKNDPLRNGAPAPRLTFDVALVGPLAGHERRLVRYRVVRLLDAPDELRGSEIGYLDQGDEVQLLEKHGAYWLVLTPDGRQGWLHKMTLGDTVGEPQEGGPMATMPLVADSWTMADADDGRSVLDSYLAARRREE